MHVLVLAPILLRQEQYEVVQAHHLLTLPIGEIAEDEGLFAVNLTFLLLQLGLVQLFLMSFTIPHCYVRELAGPAEYCISGALSSAYNWTLLRPVCAPIARLFYRDLSSRRDTRYCNVVRCSAIECMAFIVDAETDVIVGDVHLRIELLNPLNHLVQDSEMGSLFGLASDCLCVPEDQRVDPLVAMPALIFTLSENLPLATSWHLLFHANNSRKNQFLLRAVLGEGGRLLINSLLLHYLTEPDCISSDKCIIATILFLIL